MTMVWDTVAVVLQKLDVQFSGTAIAVTTPARSVGGGAWVIGGGS